MSQMTTNGARSKMKTHLRLFPMLAFLWVGLIAPQRALASIAVAYGNQPVQDNGWPEGALALANLESRVGYWEGPPFGGGQWQFLYRGDNASFNRAMAKFVAIRAPELIVVVHDGPGSNSFLKDAEVGSTNTSVDWTFTVWNPKSWDNLYNNPNTTFLKNDPNYHKPLASPCLDVYVGAGGLDWNKINMPAKFRVRDLRASTAKDPAKPSAPGTAIDGSRVEQCLKDLESITNGMTRAQVGSKLRPDGGLRSASPVRFVHPECPYFKINVEFEFKRDPADQNRAVESGDDKVIRVSKPSLERPVSD